MISEGVIDGLEPEMVLEYIGDLTTDADEYERLARSPEELVQERLGLELSEKVSVRSDFQAISKEEMNKLMEISKKKSKGNLPNEALEAASNKVAILVAVAAVGAAAYAVLWLWGPD
ncbi:MAG: hypothetical protein M1533_06515 [Candidatus Thermoplasmatota archaeon]|jgi:hypothetical protein|nr:hypothetical protein [Candidatus Thermoplasmatota archaeon]MCL5793936.1 hypothetical protein [Candidatus Thermoplasmatota archaeon]